MVAAEQMMTTQIPSVKLVLLGESSVGKSSIVAKYATDTFIEGKEATIGAAFLARVCSTGDRDIKFEIWDTAGQERFHSLAPMYYRNALAAMVVFDVTNYTTFTKAKNWVKELQRQGNSNLLITLVGNKTDLINDREVPKEEVDVYIKEECKLLYIETSAKLGTNIHHVFTEIAKTVSLEQINPHQSTSGGGGRVNLSNNKTVKSENNSNNCAC